MFRRYWVKDHCHSENSFSRRYILYRGTGRCHGATSSSTGVFLVEMDSRKGRAGVPKILEDGLYSASVCCGIGTVVWVWHFSLSSFCPTRVCVLCYRSSSRLTVAQKPDSLCCVTTVRCVL